MTSKRARHVSGKGAVWHMSSEQATLAKMPKCNGLRLRLRCSRQREIPSRKIETCLESADAKRRSLSGLLPDCGICSAGSLRL